jgi:DNA-3-methyladenine glycosylase II
MRKAVNHLKKNDPIMRAVIERVGPCRMEFGPPEFHSLAESIVSKQKSAYLKDLSAKVASGLLDFARLPQQSDDEVIAHLTQVKGIGVWTAHMFLMFTLKRENVLPTGDYGIRMAMFKHYLDRQKKIAAPKAASKKGKTSARKLRPRKIKLPTPAQMEKIARSWEPYRSVACWYLWRSLDIKTI